MSETVQAALDARGVATLVLNRPDKGNAFDAAMLAAMAAQLAEWDRDPGVHAVVLRGGGRHFCAGAEIGEAAHGASGPTLAQVCAALDRLSKPVLAVVQGACIGGAVAFVACCDIVLAGEDAFFAIPEVRLGLVPGPLLPFFLRGLTGRSLRRYALSGERFGAREALREGLVHEVSPRGELDVVLARLLEEVLLSAPGAVAATKRAIARLCADPAQAALAAALDAEFETIHQGAEAAEGRASFQQKRKPAWYPRGMTPSVHAPLRTLADVEALERAPLAARITSWNAMEWLRAGGARDPARHALHFVADADPSRTPDSLTYAELWRRVDAAARLFRSLGVGPGDTVMTLLPTTPDLYVALLGAMEAGAVCCANPALPAVQWLELARLTRAKVIVALAPTPGWDIWERLAAMRGEAPAGLHLLAANALGGAAVPDADFAARCRAAAGPGGPPRAAAAAELAAYVHTGGTPGAPRLVKITHGNLVYKLWATTVVEARRPGDVVFSDVPMFHIAGLFGRGLLPLANGNTVVIPTPLGARDKRFLAGYWKLVERYRISVLSGVPTTLAVLAKNGPRGEDLTSLRPYMTTGSTALSMETARQIEAATGVRVLATYGAAELTMNVSQQPRDGEPRPGSAGLRLPYTRVRAVQLNGDGTVARECAPGEIGTIAVQGPGVTPGYAGVESAGRSFTPDGWFISGDLGRIDADGFIWLTERESDVIIRSGHSIDPRIIEDALRSHPGVLHAAAVGKPDAHAGEVPVAFVEMVGGARASTAELLRFARDHIGEAATVPEEIVLLARMPLTDAGKPDKVALRREAAARQAEAPPGGAAG